VGAVRALAPYALLTLAWVVANVVADDGLSDLRLYASYGDAVWRGEVPYRDVFVEYPPLALVPIVLAAAGPASWFEPAFSALMLGFGLLAQHEVRRFAGDGPAYALAALPLALGAVTMERFDLMPIALTLLGLRLALLDHRVTLAFVVLALATATKLFPALAILALVVWLPRRQALRGGAAATLTLLLTCLPFVALSPSGFTEQFRFHAERPVQIESTPAVIARAIGGTQVTGIPTNPDPYRSQGLEGGATDGVAIFCVGAMLVAFALALRRPPLIAAYALILAFAALGKVLSPQYMLWLAPLAAAAWGPGRKTPAILIAIATAVTHLGFPHHYWDLVYNDPFARSLIGARDVLLLTALGSLLATRQGPLDGPGSRAPRLVS
jgi:hypothetical protein